MNHNTDYIGQLTALFKTFTGALPEHTQSLPVSGSERRYVRFTGNNKKTIIGVYNSDQAENNTFFYFSGIFKKAELPVPKVLATGQGKKIYLIEDLGGETLYDVLREEGFTERVKSLYKKAIEQLVRFHWQTGGLIDYSMCFGSRDFDSQQILTDLFYFKYYFTDVLQVKYNKQALFEELKSWSKNLAAKSPKTFMYRDFQSRNIVVMPNEEVGFVDYQGGMLGLPEYDLVSLLWQSRAQLPDKWKSDLLNYYFEALETIPEKSGIKETEFRKTYLECVLLRMLQTLGAYGFRGLIQQKEIFIKSIFPALKQLSYFLDEYPQYPHYSELRKLLDVLVKPEIMNRFAPLNYSKSALEKLHIRIYSFSFKKGIPVDETGNGGGFVFDCRGIFNPGREEEYQSLTGKDKPVKDFLEQRTEMPEFLKGIFSSLDITVKNYLERGFEHLSVSFGCTGGQHRSVYAAEAFAFHLKSQFGLVPSVIHLEQEKNKIKRK